MIPPSTNSPDAAKLTLASTSPRRREIIRAAVAGAVDVRAALGDEPRPAAGESPERYAVRSALAKLGDGGRAAPNEIIAAADTVVAMDGEIFGKPTDADDARTTLRRLRNRWHRVVTGVAVLDERGLAAADTETSRILTRAYSDGDIERWIALGAPFDKAGGYAIQDDRFRARLARGRMLSERGRLAALPLADANRALGAAAAIAPARPHTVL